MNQEELKGLPVFLLSIALLVIFGQSAFAILLRCGIG